MENKRLNKYISESSSMTRKEADACIEAARVTVNGHLGTIGTSVNSGDKVALDGKILKNNIQKVYLAFNKPVGITCSTDHKDPSNIIDYIRYPKKIFPIGRIDKDSEGLILLTNDGDIVNKILRAGNNHEKEYQVTVDKKISEQFIQNMGNGVRIHNTTTKKCKLIKTGPFTFRIILVEGLNRQIRLMCEAFGYRVVALKRIRIMNIELKGLETGTFKELNGKDLDNLLRSLANSSKTSLNRGRKRQNRNNPSVRYAERQNSDKSKKAKKKSPIRNKMKSKKK